MGKLQKKIKLKNTTTIIAIMTAATATALFLIKGFYYFYKWGYYNTLKIDLAYINVEKIENVYYVLGYIGISGMLATSNYITYDIYTKKKRLSVFLFWIVEMFFFWGIVLVSANLELKDVLVDLIRGGLWFEYLMLALKILVYVVTFNLIGIYWGEITRRVTSKEFNREEESGENINSYELIKIALGIFIFLSVEGLATYYMGVSSANNKKDYKAIVEEVESVDYIDNKYKFRWNNKEVVIYPILYENEEQFLVSKLYNIENEIYVENNCQKVISKQGIETIYFENIFALGELENNKEDK